VSSYKQKLTPLDFFMEDPSTDQIKLFENDRTLLVQKNFKYFVGIPHISYGARSPHHKNLLGHDS
jgi:hypothetical protein